MAEAAKPELRSAQHTMAHSASTPKRVIPLITYGYASTYIVVINASELGRVEPAKAEGR
jgi:hypothetical protein